MVLGAGVLGEDFFQGLQVETGFFYIRERVLDLLAELVRDDYGEGLPGGSVYEAGGGVRVGVCVAYVGLYIINRCTVHEVCAADVEDGAVRGGEVDALQPDGG